jgi:ribosomal protein L30
MAETKKTTATKTVKSSETKAAAPKTAAKKTTSTAKAAAPKTAAEKTTKTTATKASTTKATTAKKAPAKTAEVKAVETVKVEEVKPVVEKKAAPAPKKANGPMIKVTLVKSGSGRLQNQIRTLKALGLNKTNSSNVLPDNKAVRGMIFVVKHLVSVEIVK